MNNEIDNLIGLAYCLHLLAQKLVYEEISSENNLQYTYYILDIKKEIEDMIERIENSESSEEMN